MKIAFCLGSMRKGGAERVIANLSNIFIKKYDVSIITTISSNSMYKLDNKIHMYSLDENKKENNIFSRNFSRVKRLIKIIKEDNPDIIVSLLPEPTFRVMFANLFLHKKVIISVRNDPKIEYNTFFKKLLVKLLYTKADGFIFQTKEAKEWFCKKIQDKSTIIPNPINSNFICKPYSGIRNKEIVTVGRLTKQKNHILLIDAFEKVLVDFPDYILKIYGTGELENELKEYVSKKHLNDKIIFMGNVDNVKDAIYKSQLFVLSSDYEGMPNALMEAMSLGLPCISTDCPCGGPRFLIQNGENGLLVPINDLNSLSSSIITLLKDKKKACEYSDKANLISQKLNPTIINGKWEKYINYIVGLDK